MMTITCSLNDYLLNSFFSFQGGNEREYFEVGAVLETTQIDIINSNSVPDRKFLNKLLQMVFTIDELRISSAKGHKSHGKSHKPLNGERLRFVERKIIERFNIFSWCI